MPAFEQRDRIETDHARVKQAGSFFNEFMYHQLITRMNASVEPYQRIKTTKARELRAQLSHELAKAFEERTGQKLNPAVSICWATSTDFMKGFTRLISTQPGGEAFAREILGNDGGISTVKDITVLFRSISGIDGKAAMPKPRRPMLPLSPYDPRFSNRKVFIENGRDLLYADAAELAARMEGVPVDPSRPAGPDNPTGYLSFVNAGPMLDENVDLYAYNDELGTYKKKGPAIEMDDLTGVSALRPFMSDAEYRDITRDYGGVPWANAATGTMVDNGVSKSVPLYMSRASVERVRGVVAALRAEGASFRFMPDRRPGQVKIRFSNGMDVRVLDPYEEAYAGARVYKDGMSAYYQVPSYALPAGMPGAGSNKTYVEYMPRTVDECLTLIRFVRGDAVPQFGVQGRRIGEMETWTFQQKKGTGTKNRTFHNKSNFRAKAGEVQIGGKRVPVSVYYKSNRAERVKGFETEADAEGFLRESVESARGNILAAVDVDRLVREAAEHADELDEYMPVMSSQEDVAAIQRDYWDVLCGARETLLRPQFDRDDFTEAKHTATEQELRDMCYEGTPEEIVRAHAQDMVQKIIGSVEPDAGGKRFDPVMTAKFMSSAYGEFRNIDDLVRAMRRLKYSADGLKGDAFYNNVVNDRLIQYEPESAVSMRSHPSPFVRDMFRVVKESLETNACQVADEDIKIDANGIVHYEVMRVKAEGVRTKDGVRSDLGRVTGEIGRVLVPDAKGVVHANGYYFVPGYEAFIEPNRPGEDRPYEERMVLSDYKTVLARTIRERIREDLLSEEPSMGEPTSLDNVVRHLYETRYDEDFYERTAEDGMTPELRDAIIATNRSRVRIVNEIMSGSDRVSLYMALNKEDYDPLDDYRMDAITLTGGRDVAIQELPGDGMFDKYFTGNGGSQGVRYLVEGAAVDDTGHVVPSPDPEARCAMTNYLRATGRMPDFDAADRFNMTGNGLLHCLRETKAVGTVQMSFGSQTFEDGIAASKRFAGENQVRDAETGEFRPLMPGDKIECHGNKGVISFVIDPDMPEAEARKKGIWDQVRTFRDNPELDVVLAPYSPVSRFNAGLAREALASGPDDLVLPDGSIHEGAIGHVKFTILEQTADSKTHVSEDGTQKRSYGAQMCWALAANDCPAVMKAVFRDNHKAASNLREMLIAVGMDMDPTGRLQIGYHQQEGETRNIIEMEPLVYERALRTEAKKTLSEAPEDRRAEVEEQLMSSDAMSYDKLRRQDMKTEFGELIDQMGGFVEIPFPIKFPGGDETGATFRIPDETRTQAAREAYPGPVYALPLISSYMRAGQEFADGDSVLHDYTASYLGIYDAALTYRDIERKIALGDYGAGKTEADLRAEQKKAVADAQLSYNRITDDLEHRRFEGKHNVFRTSIMANKQSRSGTAIWSPDPSLPVECVAVNPEIAAKLGIKEGDHVLVHRDPVLQRSGIRSMVARFDERLAGISVNPVGIPGGMDGDFDGDTIGLNALQGAAAQAEAKAKLSVAANLLDKTSYDPKTGEYDLFLATGQDVAAAWAADPSLKDRYQSLRKSVNVVERHAERLLATGRPDVTKDRNGDPVTWDQSTIDVQRQRALVEINSYVQKCNEKSFGRHVISFASPEALVSSIDQFVADGAKGSTSKVDEFCRFAGITYERDAAGKVVPGTVAMADHTLASREANVGILQAKNAQQKYTGFGGKFSIRAMRALMNVAPDEATMLCKAATQGVLQVKHDAAQADKLELLLTGPARDVWRGYKLEPCTVPIRKMVPERGPDGKVVIQERVEEFDSWRRVIGEDGKPVKATTQEFQQQFLDVYGSKRGMGLGVNVRALASIAGKLDDGHGYVMDIESDALDKYGAPLQRAAYDGDLQTLRDLARTMASDPQYPGLFEAMPGTPRDYNGCMADASVVSRNLATKRRNEALPEEERTAYLPIYKKDTVAEGEIHEKVHKQFLAGQSAAVTMSRAEQAEELWRQRGVPVGTGVGLDEDSPLY